VTHSVQPSRWRGGSLSGDPTVKVLGAYTLRMLTRADFKRFSFGFFRDLSPSSDDGIPDGIDSERRAERQSEQGVAGLGND
jgi:hypothetical protein